MLLIVIPGRLFHGVFCFCAEEVGGFVTTVIDDNLLEDKARMLRTQGEFVDV